MEKIINEVKKNKKPLIIGGLLGLLIGIYGTNHYYQSEYAKLTAFTSMFGLGDIANKVRGDDKEDIDQAISHIKKVRYIIDEQVMSKLNKIDRKISEVAINNQKSSEGIMSVITEFTDDKKSCDCNEVKVKDDSQEQVSSKDSAKKESNG